VAADRDGRAGLCRVAPDRGYDTAVARHAVGRGRREARRCAAERGWRERSRSPAFAGQGRRRGHRHRGQPLLLPPRAGRPRSPTSRRLGCQRQPARLPRSHVGPAARQEPLHQRQPGLEGRAGRAVVQVRGAVQQGADPGGCTCPRSTSGTLPGTARDRPVVLLLGGSGLTTALLAHGCPPFCFSRSAALRAGLALGPTAGMVRPAQATSAARRPTNGRPWRGGRARARRRTSRNRATRRRSSRRGAAG